MEIPELFFIEPMECKEVRNLRDIPRGKDWQYELKFDGYRCLATVRKRDVTLYSRNGKRFDQFPGIVEALQGLRVKSCILDGEIVALDETGRSSFNALQRSRTNSATIHYYIFDLLHLDGKDLRELPLSQRQNLLWKTFPRLPEGCHFSKPIDGGLETIIELIEQLGFEGIIAKWRDSIYLPGKVPGTWVKKKLKRSDEFIIGGYVRGKSGVDSILVGKYDGEKLMFIADVDDGFVPMTRKQVFKAIEKLKIDSCPFANLPEPKGKTRWGGKKWDLEKMKTATWVKPKVVVEIAMNEWTPDKRLRHSEFVRLRKDKTAAEVSPYPVEKKPPR